MTNKHANEWNYRKGKAITALIVGILSCVGAFCFYPGWMIGLICGILAIVFGALAKSGVKRGIAIAGMVLGIVGTSLCGVLLLGVSLSFWLMR